MSRAARRLVVGDHFPHPLEKRLAGGIGAAPIDLAALFHNAALEPREQEGARRIERLDTIGRGWEEPVGTDSDKNRRVEVYWFTLE